MPKKIGKQVSINWNRDETAAVIAAKYRVTPRYVRLVMNGDRENEEILADCIEYRQAKKALQKNFLLKAVEELVPFNNPKN